MSYADYSRRGNVRQRHWRTRLRWPVVIVAGIAILAGFQVQLLQNQRAVLAEIAKLDAQVVYDHEARGQTSPPGPRWLRQVLGDDFFDDVAGISIAREGVTDETVAAIATLPHLKSLLLNSDGISDLGLARITRLTELGELGFRSSSVTDAGLAQIAECRGLTTLRIIAPHITDIGLIPLQEMPHLALVELISTAVTQEGVALLRAALPRCEVHVLAALSE